MTINVAYSCDEAYMQHTCVSILSLLENNRQISELNIYFIEKDVQESSIDLLVRLVETYNRKLEVISFNDICYDISVNSTGRHIITIYAKLFFQRIKGINKILYIDSDTIICQSLKELWEYEMEDCLAAGVETYTPCAKTKLGLSKSDRCINDGVVLLNLELFRELNILEEFKNCIIEFDGNPPVLSEGVINKVCKDRIKILHPKYNLMSGLLEYKRNRFSNMISYYDNTTIKEAIESPVIIHYLSGFYNRPWNIYCTHPMKDIYLHYKSKSFWSNKSLEKVKLNFRLRIINYLYKILPHDLLDFIHYMKNRKDY